MEKILTWIIDHPLDMPMLARAIGKSNSLERGKNRSPTWEDVESHLNCIATHKGCVSLCLCEEIEEGPLFISVTRDRLGYLMMLGELTMEDGQQVRLFHDSEAPDKQVDFQGDYHWQSTICTNLSIVKEAFRQFYETQDVSRDILD